jgi:hypothetical protein
VIEEDAGSGQQEAVTVTGVRIIMKIGLQYEYLAIRVWSTAFRRVVKLRPNDKAMVVTPGRRIRAETGEAAFNRRNSRARRQERPRTPYVTSSLKWPGPYPGFLNPTRPIQIE